MHISELETPALVIDLDIMERNLARVANYAREHNLRLRPHTKTHKIPPSAAANSTWARPASPSPRPPKPK
jgi:D-serine deaminase-like pyridoxal phosphate-dependent protein